MVVIFGGYDKSGTHVFDKLFQNFLRCTLHIKATTCNPVVYGEYGRFPPNVYCHINVLCYYRRLVGMSESGISKSVFKGLYRMHQQGFPTWIGRTCALAEQYDIDLNGTMDMSTETFKAQCAEVIKRNFINRWTSDLCNTESRILKTYTSYKCDFNTGTYLEVISVPKYHIALSKLISSSHNLEIERGMLCATKENIRWTSLYALQSCWWWNTFRHKLLHKRNTTAVSLQKTYYCWPGVHPSQ